MAERLRCTELVSWEHAACPLSGIKKRPLVGDWLNTSSIVISIGATASVRYREVNCPLVGGSVMGGSTHVHHRLLRLTVIWNLKHDSMPAQTQLQVYTESYT